MRKYLVLAILTLGLIIYVKTNINLMDYIQTQITEFTTSIFDFDFDSVFVDFDEALNSRR